MKNETWKIRCVCMSTEAKIGKKIPLDGKSKHSNIHSRAQTNSLNGPLLMQNVWQAACIFKVLSLFRRLRTVFFLFCFACDGCCCCVSVS